MRQSKFQFNFSPIYLIYILFLLFILEFLGVSFASEIFIYAYFIFTIFSTVIIISKNRYIIRTKAFVSVILFFVISLFLTIFNNVAFGNFAIVNCIMLYFFAFSSPTLKRKNLKSLLVILLIIVAICFMQSVNIFSNKLNPNYVAQVILISSIAIYYIFAELKFKKKWTFIFSIISIVIVYYCECRNVLVGTIIMAIIVNILPKRIKESKKNLKISGVLSLVFGILYPIAITFLYKNGVDVTVELFGKTFFSGREAIWHVVLEKIDSVKDILIGVSTSEYWYLLPNKNLHNIYLVILMNYGIICYYIFYKSLLQRIFAVNNKNKYTLSWGIIVTLFVGAMENVFMSGTIAFLFCIVYCLLEYDCELDNNKIMPYNGGIRRKIEQELRNE